MIENQCTLCPRDCKVDRRMTRGFCGAPLLPMVAKAMLHKWEEPVICYGAGSGAVFFSGCQLRCVFCQNHEISQRIAGKEMNRDSLASLFLSLQEKGACNINLVSPTPYLEEIIPALSLAKKQGLSIPVLMNSGGYESAETLRRLDGLIDIYLPDFKFSSPDLSSRYTKACDYALRCKEALLEMHRQTGPFQWDGEHLRKGLIIRHLILPGASADSLEVLDTIASLFPERDVLLSLMRQYTPMFQANKFPELTRRITSLEYRRVVTKARDLGFTEIFTQEKESADERFVPDFSVFFEETN